MEIGKDSDLLLRLMTATTQRARVIAGNLANQNTTDYVRKVVEFESLLLDELEQGGQASAALQPRIVEDHSTPPGSDGNNVNLETELNAMRENRILYETYSAILAHRMELLRSSIQDTR